MKKLSEYTKTELIQRKEELQAAYCEFQNRNLHLDLSRGKPEKRQLELSMPMLDLVGKDEWYSEEGLDCRNYGGFEGLAEVRRLFGELLGVPEELVFPGGNSSLSMIHDAISRAILFGPLPGFTPWSKLPEVKFI